MIHYTESHSRLALCLLVVQLCGNLFQTVENSLAKTQGRQALQLHYLWKEFQLGGRSQNSYRPPSQDTRTASPTSTIALSVERASPGRTPSEVISAAQPRHKYGKNYNCTICGKSFSWADALITHIGRPRGIWHQLKSDRKSSLENTPFSLSNFS